MNCAGSKIEILALVSYLIKLLTQREREREREIEIEREETNIDSQ